MGNKGRFVWYELLAGDPEAAKAFYGTVVGWKAQPWDADAGAYSVLTAGETPVGGVMKLLPEFECLGKRPHWWAHVAVEDVDGGARRAEELGGRILKPGTEIPKVGRFAIVADPQGAIIALFRGQGEEMPAPDLMRPGGVSWHELHTTDLEGAWRFYAGLFGWQPTETLDLGAMGPYRMFRNADDPANAAMGGMFNAAKVSSEPPHWLYYLHVEAMDGAVARLRKEGGTVLQGPMDVPGGGRAAQCRDPQGADFGLFSLK